MTRWVGMIACLGLLGCADSRGGASPAGDGLANGGSDQRTDAKDGGAASTSAGSGGVEGPDRSAPTGGSGAPADPGADAGADAGEDEPAAAQTQFPGDVVDGCVDVDGDGFGRGCEPGRDCDDEDSEITDDCYRCRTPNDGCPCEPGSDPLFCDPPDMEVPGGRLVCNDGTRYCREGSWSECEIVGEYVFIPDP